MNYVRILQRQTGSMQSMIESLLTADHMAEAGISQAALVRATWFSYVITITKRNIYLKGCTVLTRDLKIQPEGM